MPNFSAGAYNRRMAGAFVKDGSGDIFVAHRGRLTKGNAGLPKDKVFRELAASNVEAADSQLEVAAELRLGAKSIRQAQELICFAQLAHFSL